MARPCHFNLERIYSPLSGWESIGDEDYGSGYVIGSKNGQYIFNDTMNEEQLVLDKKGVYVIERPGSLIHFYVNQRKIGSRTRNIDG